MDNPVFFWNPAFNPSSMLFYTGDRFPRLRGSLLVAGAGSQTVAQLTIRGDFIRQGDTMLSELGVRFRDMRQGPDGYLYLLTEGRIRGPRDTDGMLLRVEPGPVGTDSARASRTAAVLEDLQLPDAPGRGETLRACTGCHGVGILLAQGRSGDEWTQVVNAMLASGLTLGDDEYATIIAYLREHLSAAPPAEPAGR
jgi:hypothetical protein